MEKNLNRSNAEYVVLLFSNIFCIMQQNKLKRLCLSQVIKLTGIN